MSQSPQKNFPSFNHIKIQYYYEFLWKNYMSVEKKIWAYNTVDSGYMAVNGAIGEAFCHIQRFPSLSLTGTQLTEGAVAKSLERARFKILAKWIKFELFIYNKFNCLHIHIP